MGNSWPSQLTWTVLCAAAMFWSVCFPLTNTDIWWHLATGRWIVEQGRIPGTDPFAAGTQGEPWINLHWLFQLGALGLYRLGGALALVLAKAGLLAAGGAVLLRAVRDEPWPHSYWPLAALCCAAAVFVARHLVLARPVVLTLLALAVFVLVLERYRRSGRLGLLLWLLPLQVLWANTQGGLQLLGPAVVLAYLVGESLTLLIGRRVSALERPEGLGPQQLVRLLGLLPMLLVGALITPSGIDGLALPLRLFGRIDPVGSQLFALNVSENVPPWLLERGAAAVLEVTSFKWVGALAMGSFLLPLLRGRPVALARLLLLGGVLGLALGANRNILLFNWLAGPIAAGNLAAALPARRGVGAAAVALALAGLAGMAALRYQIYRADPPLGQPAPFRVPDRAVDRLEQLGLDRDSGPLFNSVRYGGYLIWRLFPRATPAIDGRLVLRSAARFAEHLDLADRPALFPAYARRHGIRTVLLPTALPGRYLPLVVWLYRDPAWRLLYTDGTQTLFVHWERDIPEDARPLDLSRRATVQGIAAGLRRRWQDRPAVLEQARLHLGRLLAAVGAHGRAREVLEHCRGHAARSLLARVHLLAGDGDRARALARQLIQSYGDNVNDLLVLAQMAAKQGDRQRAVDLLERALAVDPRSPQARRLLERLAR